MPNGRPTRSHLRICCHGLGGGQQHLLGGDAPGPGLDQGLVLVRRPSAGPAAWRTGPSSAPGTTTKTTSEVTPEMMNWLFHPVMGAPARKWSRVLAATMLVIRLPATGPTVQNPMAEARPTWGLKSRTMAGVATRMAPSTRPRAEMTMAKPPLGRGQRAPRRPPAGRR